MTNTKQCQGCNAILLKSDPDLCELCDLHGHDRRNPVPGRRDWSADTARKAGDIPANRKGRAHCPKHDRFHAGCFACMSLGFA